MALLSRLSRRSLVWLLPAVLVPLTALLVMQYQFLRKIEETTAVVRREQVNSYLDAVAHEVEDYYRQRSEQALSVCCGLIDPISEPELAEHFRAHPIGGATQFFVRTFPPGDEGRTMFFSVSESGEPIDEGIQKAVELATAPWAIIGQDGSVVRSPHLVVDPLDPRYRLILRPIVNERSRLVGVAGVMIDDRLARKKVIEPLSRRQMRDRFGWGTESFVVKVLPATSRKPLPPSLDVPEVRQYRPFSFLFTNKMLVADHFCITPEQLASQQFRFNMIWTGAVAIILLMSILLAVRTTLREAKLSRMKSDFVSNVSHELRTPLSSIRVFGEYMSLGRVKDPTKVQEYGRYIETEGRRLTQLINNILDFSKIESAGRDYVFEETDLADLVRDTVDVFRTPLEKSGFAIELHIDGPIPPLAIDRDAMSRALLNLLDNAKKYSNGSSRIEVILERAGDVVRLAVRDWGVGIPADEQTKIFEKFYRVSTGLVHDVKGSGLGLAIVDHIVRAHGGRIELESRPGKGSRFTMILPTGPGHKQPSEKRENAPLVEKLGGAEA